MIKGVITGDIINSTKLDVSSYQSLTSSINETISELASLSAMSIDFFRGDSFQIIVDSPSAAIKIAILLRATIKSHAHQSWDARLSVGIGGVSHLDAQVSLSNGEAFILSGHGLDEIGKKRLVVKTPWEPMNASLEISTLFVDDIITGWTPNQAMVSYMGLRDNMTQKAIATQLNKSKQNVSKLLASAKTDLIGRYIHYYSDLIEQATKSS